VTSHETTTGTPTAAVNGTQPDAADLSVGINPEDDENMYVEPGTPLWMVVERLVLTDGEELSRVAGRFESEPHQGDVMTISGSRVERQLAQAFVTGVLRFMPDDAGIFFTHFDKVEGIYVEVLGPQGEEVYAADLKPGYQGQDNGEE
jgi:hypothetical protein